MTLTVHDRQILKEVPGYSEHTSTVAYIDGDKITIPQALVWDEFKQVLPFFQNFAKYGKFREPKWETIAPNIYIRGEWMMREARGAWVTHRVQGTETPTIHQTYAQAKLWVESK